MTKQRCAFGLGELGPSKRNVFLADERCRICGRKLGPNQPLDICLICEQDRKQRGQPRAPVQRAKDGGG